MPLSMYFTPERNKYLEYINSPHDLKEKISDFTWCLFYLFLFLFCMVNNYILVLQEIQNYDHTFWIMRLITNICEIMHQTEHDISYEICT